MPASPSIFSRLCLALVVVLDLAFAAYML